MTIHRKPLDQGSVDGLCGLYSITNCVRLLYPEEINDNVAASMFQALAHSLDRWPSILWDGTEPNDMLVMLDAAKDFLAIRGIQMWWRPPFLHKKVISFSQFQGAIESSIVGSDCFAIVGLSKPWEHWTTIDHFSPKNIILSDSCHVKEIPLDQCGRTGSGSEYQFDFEDTYLLSRALRTH